MNVVRLGRPGRPRDGGLAPLGVVMMASAIACGALAWCAAVIAVIDAMCSMAVSEDAPQSLLSRASPVACTLAVVLTVARGLLGYRAGQALATGHDARARLGVYAGIGLGHAVAVAAVVAPTWPPVEVAAVVAVLCALPLAAIVVGPRGGAGPRTGALEAVPVLALLAGVVTLVIATALLVPGLHLARSGLAAAGDRYVLVPPFQALLIFGTGLGFVAAALALALAVVGALMIRAGLGGRAALDQAAAASGFFGFVLVIALSILVLTAVAIPAVVALGMAFPQLLVRTADAEPPRPPDPGARRAALGWILLGHALLAAAGLLPAALTGAATTLAAGVVAAPGTGWTGVALAVVELAAGVALLSGFRTARWITVAWSAFAIAVAVTSAGPPILGAWFSAVPVAALAASSPLTETLRARARLVRSLGA